MHGRPSQAFNIPLYVAVLVNSIVRAGEADSFTEFFGPETLFLAQTTSPSAAGSLLTPTAYFEIAYFNHLYVLTKAE